MKLPLIIAALVFTATLALAEDFTIDGNTYEGVEWVTSKEQAAQEQKVTFRHSTGIATFTLDKLPAELQQRFGYDPDKLAEIRAAEVAQQEEETRKARDADALKRKQDEDARAAAAAANLKAAEEAARRQQEAMKETASTTELIGLLLKRDTNAVKKFVAAHPDAASGRDAQGRTPLHWLAENGEGPVFRGIAELLISNKADVNAKDKEGIAPLHLAAKNGHTNLMNIFIANTADVNIKDANWLTPMHYAAQSGRLDAVKELIAHQAKVNLRSKRGETPLSLASKAKRDLVVDYLSEHGGTL